MLLETLKIINGKAPFLSFHNERLNRTRQILINTNDKIDLKNVITAPPPNGIYRCRIIYSKTIESIEYLPHQKRNFQTFKIIKDDKIDYAFKYLNRDNLNCLIKLKESADDILIIKNGFVTDTSIANVAFLHKNKWLTPSTPLLKGTTRERFLKTQKIIETEIHLEDLNKFSKMVLMNALLDFYVVDNLVFT
jgi:4-amino-4-deoxychorismate lyase